MNTRSLSLLFVGVMACSSSSSSPPGSGGTNSATGGKGTGGGGPGTGGTTGSGGALGTGGAQPGTGGSSGTGGGGAVAGASGSGGSGVAGSGIGGRSAIGGGTVATGGSAGTAAPPSGFAVVTDRYDNARTGANLSETILTPSNVTAARFGLLFSRTIVGDAYGQPLYVGGLTVNGAKHNVVYIATQRNMVYAFDADAATPDTPLWSKSMGTSMTLGSGADYDPTCLDMRREVGISSTPVISLADGKLFVVAKTAADQQLHALDLATGTEGVGSPVSVGRTAMPAFDPRIHLNRPALLLMNGVVYIAYGSHCDNGAYHGWIFGYDAKTMALKTAYNTTPNGGRGAIWQSGVGLSSDGTDIWATIGNAESPGNGGFGNSVVRLTPNGAGLTVTSHFQAPVGNNDNDLQSGAPLLGTTGQVVAGGKDGEILLLGQSDLASRQRMPIGGELNSFVFWNGAAGPTLFTWQVGKPLQAYRVGNGTLTKGATGSVSTSLHPSAIFTLSSNGTMPGTGIVWGSDPVSGDAWHATAVGRLYAIDATTLTTLWDSGTGADALGTYAKYSPPIVANGKVYVATFSGKLQVYGLK